MASGSRTPWPRELTRRHGEARAPTTCCRTERWRTLSAAAVFDTSRSQLCRSSAAYFGQLLSLPAQVSCGWPKQALLSAAPNDVLWLFFCPPRSPSRCSSTTSAPPPRRGASARPPTRPSPRGRPSRPTRSTPSSCTFARREPHRFDRAAHAGDAVLWGGARRLISPPAFPPKHGMPPRLRRLHAPEAACDMQPQRAAAVPPPRCRLLPGPVELNGPGSRA